MAKSGTTNKFTIEWTEIKVVRIYQDDEVCCCGHRYDHHDNDIDLCMWCDDWCNRGFNEPPATWQVASSKQDMLEYHLASPT